MDNKIKENTELFNLGLKKAIEIINQSMVDGWTAEAVMERAINKIKEEMNGTGSKHRVDAITAKELAKIIEGYDDFKVQVSLVDEPDESNGYTYPNFRFLNIKGLADIGHSGKVIILDCEEDE